jgi:cytochrome b6-f complex subunit 7
LKGAIFMGEIFTTALLSSSLILVGLVLGFALLKIQGGEE